MRLGMEEDNKQDERSKEVNQKEAALRENRARTIRDKVIPFLHPKERKVGLGGPLSTTSTSDE